MKKNYYPTLISLTFFAGTFLIVFTSSDSDVAAFRFITYLFVSCFLAVSYIYKDILFKAKEKPAVTKMEHVLNDAEKFSQEFGEVYVLADKLKQQRKQKKGAIAANRPA